MLLGVTLRDLIGFCGKSVSLTNLLLNLAVTLKKYTYIHHLYINIHIKDEL